MCVVLGTGNSSPFNPTSEPLKKTFLLSIESWLFNGDPYNGFLQSLFNWVVFHPRPIPQPTKGPFFIAQVL